MEFREEILQYARATAQLLYPTALLEAHNGLQPLEDFLIDGVLYPGLLSKYKNKLLEEFQAAKIAWLHEPENTRKRTVMQSKAASCAYYAIQIGEQKHTTDTLEDTLLNFAGPSSQLDPEHIKIAARIKYKRRSQGKGTKDHEREYQDIERAISRYERQKAQQNRAVSGVLSARRIPPKIIAVFSREAAKQNETLENYVRVVLIEHAIQKASGMDNKDTLRTLLKEAVDRMEL